MAKGDGSITKLGPSRYRIQISYGKDPITGKYQRATKVVSGTKAEARKVRDQMRKEREGGLVLDGSKLTFEEFADKFLELAAASDEIGPETLKNHKSRLKCICRYIGGMKLKKITPQVIEATLAAIKRDKIEERGSFKNATLRNYYGELQTVLQKAVDYDFIMRNPCDKVKAPVAEKVNRRSLDTSEASAFLKLVDEREEKAYARLHKTGQNRHGWPTERVSAIFGVSFITAVRIGLATGMRVSEVLGLLWDCVDFDQETITVRRSLSRGKRFKEPKTDAGIRTVSLDNKTLRHLAKWKREQAVVLSRIGIEQGDLTPVCCNGRGLLMEYTNFLGSFHKLRDEACLPDLKFHELRHTQATLLLGNGADVKTVQTRLGHSDASTTLNVYAHALPENDKKAASLIGDLCAEKKFRIIKTKTA